MKSCRKVQTCKQVYRSQYNTNLVNTKNVITQNVKCTPAAGLRVFSSCDYFYSLDLENAWDKSIFLKKAENYLSLYRHSS